VRWWSIRPAWWRAGMGETGVDQMTLTNVGTEGPFRSEQDGGYSLGHGRIPAARGFIRVRSLPSLATLVNKKTPYLLYLLRTSSDRGSQQVNACLLIRPVGSVNGSIVDC
jgi:hypothetical protein